MAIDIGPKIGIEGESEFRKQIKQVNAEIKTLGTEMQVTQAAFAGQEKSEAALTATSKVLNEQITKQKEKIDLLSKGLKESAEKYGENDEKTLKWQQAVNQATTQLYKMEDELEATTRELNGEADSADKAGKKTKEAGKDAEKSGAGWKALGDTVAAVGAAMAAAAAAAAAAIAEAGKALVSFTVDAAGYADDILTMSSVTGMSTEKLQELQYAAELVDVSVDTITGSMKKNLNAMTKVQNGNEAMTEAYKRLGVEVLDANGNLRDDETVYWELINALGQVTDETERDSLAMQVLGKSAQDLNPLIEAGADKMAELAKQAHEAGAVMDEDALDAFSDFDDALNRLDAGASAAKNALGTILLPVLSDLAGDGVDLLGQFTNGILDANGDISQMDDVISEVLPQVLDIVMGYVPEILDLVMSILGSVGQSILDNLDLIIDSVVEIMKEVLAGILDALPDIVDATVELVVTMAGTIIDNLPTIIEAAIKVIVAITEGLAEALPELIPAMVDAVLLICDTVINNLDLVIDAALKLIIALAGGLIDALPRLLEKVPEIVIKLVDAIIENAPKLVQAALELILKLAEGLGSFVYKLTEKGREIVDSIWQGFKEKVENAKQWGRDLIQNFVDGLTQKWEDLKAGVRNVANTVKDFLGFSEPKKGPLSDFHTYAPDMIDLFIQGLRQGQHRLEDQMMNMFDPANLYGSIDATSVRQTSAGDVGGIVNRLTDAMRDAMGGFGGDLTVNLVVGGEKITDVVIRNINQRARSGGRLGYV